MRWRYILNTTGILTVFFGGTMAFPLGFAFFAGDSSLMPLAEAMGITLSCGSVLGFLALYVLLFALFIVLLAGTGVDFLTALGAVASSMGNIGPGFGMVGPVENYAHIPVLGKWLLCWCMLLGRLEIYTLIILVVPEFWRK